MSTRMSRRMFLLSASATLCAFSGARAQTGDEGTFLSEDYSRGEIFQDFVVDPWIVDNSSENLTLGIPSDFQFPRDVVFDCTVTEKGKCVADEGKVRRTECLFGIDVNHYTNAEDFSFDELRAQQVYFVQMKASQGDYLKDSNFSDFWKRAGLLTGKQKVFRGPYHFLTAGAEGRKQADWFLKIVERAGGLRSDDMSPGVDLEWDVYRSTGKLDHWRDKGEQYIMDTVLACLGRIEEKTGRTPVLYTGKSWFGPHTISLKRIKELSPYPLWVFDYNPLRKIDEQPQLPDSSRPATIWQFTSAARVPKCYGNALDASVFYGTEDKFKTAFGIT